MLWSGTKLSRITDAIA